jgi:hypothetical protein
MPPRKWADRVSSLRYIDSAAIGSVDLRDKDGAARIRLDSRASSASRASRVIKTDARMWGLERLP